MKKFLFISTFNFFLSFNCFSQWTNQNVNSVNELYGVEYNSPSLIFISALDGLIKSTDGGTTWTTLPLLDQGNNSIAGSWLLDAHFFNSTTGVSTGMIASGNSEVILRTTNGGANWTSVSLNNNGAWPRNLNAIYFSGTNIGYAVGTNGRILKSINSGASWAAQSSGTTLALNSVFFTSTLNGFAVGNNIILKTTNGGSNWTPTSFSGVNFKAVHFPTSTTGYAVADNSKIYKTTNAGVSWQLLAVYGTYSFTDAFFTAQDTGYVTSGNLVLKTTNGGALWEKQVISSATLHNGISFLNSSTGYLVGKNGKAYKTANAGGQFAPIASFTTTTNTFCKDSTFSFINNGPAGYTYRWFINGTQFSTTYAPSYSFSNPNQTDTISLVAYNGLLYDTAYLYPYVQPALNFTMNTVAVNDSICPITSATIQVTSSINGVTYKLRNGQTQIGNSQNGNGGTLSFSSGNINSTTTFNIIGTKTNSCGTYQQINYETVYVIPNNISLPVSATSPIICKNSSSSVIIGNSIQGTMYQLKVGSTNIGSPIMGNGTTIYLPTGNLIATTTFSIQATSTLSCVSLLTSTITITVELPKAFFTSGSYNIAPGELTNFFNNSINPAGTYYWDFGSSAIPATSTQMSPLPTFYTTLGIKTILLKAISPNGCIDSASIKINVISYDSSSSCHVSQMNCYLNGTYSNSAYSCTLDIDYDGNWYCFGDYETNQQQRLKLFSPNNNDTIALPIETSKNVFIAKYNKFGIVQWAVTSSGAGMEYSQAIHVDRQKNIFVIGYIQFGEGAFNSADNSTTMTVPSDQIYICKYDNNGVLKMLKYFPNPSTDRTGYSINTDFAGNIYFSTERNFIKLDPNGNQLWSIPHGFNWFADVIVDSAGNSYVARELGLILEKYNSAGILQWQTPSVQYVPPATSTNTTTSILKQDANGNLYIFGIFTLKFIFKNDTIINTNPISGPIQSDIFIAKFSPNGTKLKILQGVASFDSNISGAGIKNSNGYLLGTTNQGALSFGGSSINATNNGLFLFQFDTTLTPKKIIQMYDQNSGTYGWHNDALAVDSKEKLYIAEPFKANFTIAQTPITQLGCCGTSSFTAKLDTGCIFIPQGILSFTLAYSNVNCSGDNTGSITITASGGAPSYQYSIDNGNTYQTSNAFPNLVAGTYSIKVKDLNNTVTTAYSATITQPTPFTFSATQSNVTCNGGNNGSITLTANGGVTPYQFSKNNGSTYQLSNIFSNLIAGTYNIKIKDANNCITPVQAITLTQPTTAVIFSATLSNVACNGGNNGGITITTSGGVSPFQFSKNNGGTYQTSNVFTNVIAGNYNLIVKDSNNCVSSSQLVSISQPNAITFIINSTNVSCTNGRISITASGGTSPFHYSVNGGSSYLSTNTFNNLTAATYAVTVGDTNNCISNTQNVVITQSAILSFSPTTSNVACFGGNSGSITINATGGAMPYQFSSDSGQTFQSTNLFSNLLAGSYILVIKDTNNCGTSAQTVAITEPNANSFFTSQTNPTCNSGTNGSILITATGGTNPYQYTKDNGSNYQLSNTFTGLIAGTYIIKFKDAHNCIANAQTIIISEPPALPQPTINVNGLLTFCVGDSVVLSSSLGHTYSWSNGAITQSNTIFTTSNVTVTTFDTLGCPATSNPISVTVNPLPPTPIITQTGNSLSSSSQIGNQWYFNGTIITGANGQTYNATQNGNYTVMVTTTNNCKSISAPSNFAFTGIGNDSINQTYSIYPNPSNGIVYLNLNKLPKSEIKVLNYLGEVIYYSQKKVSEIDLSGKQKGIYLILILSKGSIISEKLILQ